MRIGRATVCCRAAASIVLSGHVALAAPEPSSLSLFPVRTAWTLVLGADLASQPAYAQGRGYFLLANERLVAYDLTKGVLLWTRSVQSSSPPVLGDGLIFVIEAGALTALRETDGLPAYRRPFPEDLASPLVWDNGWLIASTRSGVLIALRALDGQRIWQRDLGSPVSAAPTLADDRVYVPLLDHRVAALLVASGEPLWERSLDGPVTALLARDSRIYAGSQDNYFYCLRADNGRVDWRWRTGADVVGRPVVDGRLVYFVSLDNVLRGVDRSSGVQHWRRTLPLRPARGIVLAAGSLIISGIGPALPGFDAQDGRPIGVIEAQGDVVASPHAFEVFGLPAIALVTQDIATGASLRVLFRQIEPAIAPVAPLPVPTAPAVPNPT